jgi:hypothetical protein
MILILHYYKSVVDGVMTSMIDLYNNIKLIRPDLEIDFKIICPELFLLNEKEPEKSILYPFIDLKRIKYYKYLNNSLDIDNTPVFKIEDTNSEMFTSAIPFMQLNKNFGDISLHNKLVYLPVDFEADTIICTGRILFEMLQEDVDLKLKCKKMYVMDSLDIFRSKLGVYPDLDKAVPTDNCTFLVNPANIRKSNFNQVIHYIKFSKKRMDLLSQTQRGLSNVLDYRRTNKQKGEIYEEKYAENMGKTIFEHLYHGKTVNYYADGLFMEDGLFYYLKLFGIDGLKDHVPLKISKQEIEKKLFVNFKDFIYRL